MKVIFTFSIPQEFNPFMYPNEGIITLLEIPDEAGQIPDVHERVLSIANAVGNLTRASLSVTCMPLNIKDLIVKEFQLEAGIADWEKIEAARLLSTYMEAIVRFNYRPHDRITRQLRIAAPIASPLPKIQKNRMTKRGHFVPDKRPLTFTQTLWRPDLTKLDRYPIDQQSYYSRLLPLVENIVPLLNANPHLNDWQFQGISPLWYNETQHKQALKRIKAAERQAEKDREKQAKQEAKRQLQAEKMSSRQQQAADNGVTEPIHGAGRTIGARPGIYNGVQMRSQLEIRIASELDEREIRWIYEAEALGDAGYLVDFYLPDLKAWIEVKGRLEARDRQVLPQVAHMLKYERHHRLLMYTSSGSCFAINPSGFREIERKNFWTELFK